MMESNMTKGAADPQGTDSVAFEIDAFKRDYFAYTGTKARLAMAAKARAGMYPLQLPIGYRRLFVDGEERIEPDPKTAPLVRLAFEEIIKPGSSVQKVTNLLRQEGLKARRGKPIGHGAVHRMLTNPFYIGRLVYRGESVDGQHEAIIDQQVFNDTQVALKVRRKPWPVS